jgi:stage III sporulation protein AG
MFKIAEKDKKKIYSLGLLLVVIVISITQIGNFSQEENDTEVFESQDEETIITSQNDLEQRLVKILSQIEGAEDVDVLVTFESSEEIHPAYNTNSTVETTNEKDSQGGERTTTTSSENKTMITSNSNGPIVVKTSEKTVKGVLVVSSGANDPQVKEKLYKAVQTALQIQGHQVEIYAK